MPYPLHFLLFFATLTLVLSDCECGYSAIIDGSEHVFTDLLESDFLHLQDISLDTDWVRQNFTVTAVEARGTYGENASITDVVANPLIDRYDWSGSSRLGGNAGLQVWVRGPPLADGFVSTGEVDSARTDMFYGTYRAAMKLPDINGTTSAFTWYFNDSQEIDMEFLSAEFNNEQNVFPVNLVMQSLQSVQQGDNAAGTDTFVLANLTFNPTVGFHEYRFDFIPGLVIFYADSQILATMSNPSAIPTHSGKIILTQWSNGNPEWSRGPPLQDSALIVSYVKAYFHSTNATRKSITSKACRNRAAPKAICAIPDQKEAPNPDGPNGNVSAKTFFFSMQKNDTHGQIIYKQSGGSKYDMMELCCARGSIGFPLLTVFLLIFLSY